MFGSNDKVGWDGAVLVFVVFGWETRGDGVIPLANMPATYMRGNPVPWKKADELVLAHAVTRLILV